MAKAPRARSGASRSGASRSGASTRSSSNQSTSATIAANTRVLWNQFGNYHHAGVIKRIAEKSALVRLDEGKEVRIPLTQLRAETALDVELRDHANRMRQWKEARPKGEFANVSWGASYHDSDQAMGAEVPKKMKSPRDMRDAAHELHQLADWFEQQPIPPQPAQDSTTAKKR